MPTIQYRHGEIGVRYFASMTAVSREGNGQPELPAQIAFFASYGAACAAAAHIHYRLAYLYAVTFDDPRSASLPRVEEKFNEAFEPNMTTGRLWGLIRESQPSALRHTLDIAISLRNYLVHFLVWHTRAEQGSEEGLEALVSRLDVARDYLMTSGSELHQRHGDLLIEAGADPTEIALHSKPWDELGEATPFDVKLPEGLERIRRAWIAMNEALGPRLYLENEAGSL